MELYSAFLGKSIVDTLQARTTAPVLTIGSDTFTRGDLSKIGCFNFAAAARLSNLITNELNVKNTGDLFRNVAPVHLALPGIGGICLATIGAAFEVKKLGTLADYVNRHAAAGQPITTFHTFKDHARDTKANKRTKRDDAERKRSRQRQAHEIRVDRHVTRASRATH